MFASRKPRGMMGLPDYMTPGGGFGGGVTEAAPMGGPVGEAAPQAAKKRKGIFGTGIGIRDIIGTLGDAVAINRGIAPPHATAMRELQKLREQQELEDSKYQRQRMDKREDYVWQQENRNNDTEADFAFWKRNLTPEQFETWKQNKINPPVWRQDFATGEWRRVDPSGGGAAPKVIGPQLDDDWELEGDGASNGAGGFPRR